MAENFLSLFPEPAHRDKLSLGPKLNDGNKWTSHVGSHQKLPDVTSFPCPNRPVSPQGHCSSNQWRSWAGPLPWGPSAELRTVSTGSSPQPFPWMELFPLIHPTLSYARCSPPSILPSFVCAALTFQVSDTRKCTMLLWTAHRLRVLTPGQSSQTGPESQLVSLPVPWRRGGAGSPTIAAWLFFDIRGSRTETFVGAEMDGITRYTKEAVPPLLGCWVERCLSPLRFHLWEPSSWLWDSILWSSAAASTKRTRSTQRFPLEPTPGTDSFLFLKTLASSITLSWSTEAACRPIPWDPGPEQTQLQASQQRCSWPCSL